MKAIISTESWESLQSRALAIAEQVDAGEGESPPEADYHLSFADSAQLFAELTPVRLALLEQLKTLGTASIQALAEQLHADQGAIRADIDQLLAWELIAQASDGQLYIPWDEIEIQATLPLDRQPRDNRPRAQER
jgi:predicted transcriptional regulator